MVRPGPRAVEDHDAVDGPDGASGVDDVVRRVGPPDRRNVRRAILSSEAIIEERVRCAFYLYVLMPHSVFVVLSFCKYDGTSR